MSYYVYIIESLSNGSFYIGSSDNVERRVRRHNSGYSRYTKRHRPWKLVYTERHPSKTEALKRERFLKRQKNREFYLRLIKGGG